MSRLDPWFFAVSLALLPVVACTNEEDLGDRSAAAGDAGTATGDGSDTPRDNDGPDGSPESGAPDSGGDSFGKTAAGESCNPSSFPAAGGSCSIPGAYTINEVGCTGGACGSVPAPDYQWTGAITVTGTEVKITNGSNRLLKCQLTTACDCVSSGGSLYRFTSTGFLSAGKDDCVADPGITHYYLVKGTKQ